jgi:hypothetical protein
MQVKKRLSRCTPLTAWPGAFTLMEDSIPEPLEILTSFYNFLCVVTIKKNVEASTP